MAASGVIITSPPSSSRMANPASPESPRLPGQADECAGSAVRASGLWHKSAESERDPLPDGWVDTDSAILGRPPLAQSASFLPVVTRTSDNPATGYPQISRNRKCDRGEIRIGKGCRMYRKNPSSRLRGGIRRHKWFCWDFTPWSRCVADFRKRTREPGCRDLS